VAKGEIVGALSYAALEREFAERVAAHAERVSAVWVLVPTNLLALHLRRRTAERTAGVLGVRFLTLRDAARRVAMPALARRGLRPAPEGAVELVLWRLLGDMPDGSYLSALAQFGNGPMAVGRALRVLEDCLWTPERLVEAAPAAGRRDASAPRRLRELAEVWSGLRQWKRERGLFETADLIAAAGRADQEPAETPDMLLLYGFYDFNPSQRALVGRLIAAARECTAYLLWGGRRDGVAPGFAYAEPAVRWLARAMGDAPVKTLEPPAPQTDLERLAGSVFGEQPLVHPERARDRLPPADAFDGTVRVVSCPGERSEAEEVARAVLRAAASSEDRTAVGVLMRGAEQARAISQQLDRAGVRCYVREGLPLSETVAGRVALALLELCVGEAQRDDVVDFLSLAEVPWPEGLSAPALDRAAREAGIVRGRREWSRRLTSRARQLRRRAETCEDEAEARGCARDADTCLTAAGLLGEFFQELDLLMRPSSWAEFAAGLRRLTERYAPADQEGTPPVLEAVGELSRLDVSGVGPSPERARRLLGRRLAALSVRRERFEHVGVAASSIMAARGATFDVVILPGLVEKQFPRHVVQRSLLTELDREALNEAAPRLGCGELPLQARRPLEEQYLFRIGLASARQALVLTCSRIEEDNGRPRIPSRFLTDTCSALVGFSVTDALLEAGLPAGLVRRVPMNRRDWTPDELELALDAFEYDGAVFVGRDGAARRRAYLEAVCPIFGRAARLNDMRWGRRDFGPYDGKLGADDLLEHLRQRHGRFTAAISPTRLQTYARCPFEYFLTYVLGIEEVEAPPEEFELSPMDRGALVHDLLRAVYAERLAGRRLGDLSDEEIADTVRAAGPMLDALGRVQAENHPATWTAERERTLEELRLLLRHERREHPEARPAEFECEFGIGAPPPYVLEAAPQLSVAFRGRIDRLDRLPDGGLQVVDYKTGSGSGLKGKKLLGGRQLQLPVYLLAAAELTEARAGSALYLLVSGPGDVPQFTLSELEEKMADFRRAVRLVVEGIAAGEFFPLPASAADVRYACEQYCPYGLVCGAARGTLAEMKQTDPQADRLHELRDIE
jgi:RecB family exonuclease